MIKNHIGFVTWTIGMSTHLTVGLVIMQNVQSNSQMQCMNLNANSIHKTIRCNGYEHNDDKNSQ